MAFCLLPPIHDEEWTLAVVGLETNISLYEEATYFIKILQIRKSDFQLSSSKPVENHEMILSSMSEEEKKNCPLNNPSLIPYIIKKMTWLRPGVFAIIYDDVMCYQGLLVILDVANRQTLFFDKSICEMYPFGFRGPEAKYLIVQNEKEVYCLDLETFEKTRIDTTTDGEFTGMCVYVEDEMAFIAVILNFQKLMLYSYCPPKVTL
jgi:hypothetical protein